MPTMPLGPFGLRSLCDALREAGANALEERVDVTHGPDTNPGPERRARSSGRPTRSVRVGLPAAHTEMVERRHLADLLRRGARGPVTLLSAPAGFGKTVLVGAWAAHVDPAVPTARLTMREDDESPAVFWASAIGAFHAAGIDVSDVPAPAASDGTARAMLGADPQHQRPRRSDLLGARLR